MPAAPGGFPEALGGLQEVLGGLQEALGGVWEASRRLLEAKLAHSLVFSRVPCGPPGAPRDPPGRREHGKWVVKGLFRGGSRPARFKNLQAYLQQENRIVDYKLQPASLQDLQSAFYQSARIGNYQTAILLNCRDWKLPNCYPAKPCFSAWNPTRGRRIVLFYRARKFLFEFFSDTNKLGIASVSVLGSTR